MTPSDPVTPVRPFDTPVTQAESDLSLWSMIWNWAAQSTDPAPQATKALFEFATTPSTGSTGNPVLDPILAVGEHLVSGGVTRAVGTTAARAAGRASARAASVARRARQPELAELRDVVRPFRGAGDFGRSSSVYRGMEGLRARSVRRYHI